MNSGPDLQAAYWLARLQGRRLTPVERAEFDRWLDADPAHAVAFARAEFTWDRAQRLKALPESALGTAVRQEDVSLGGHFSRVRALSGWLAAAMVACVMIGGATWFLAGQRDVYMTEFGERRTLTLEDGSRVSLNTETRITASFDDGARTIRLERGEAMFEVAHDPRRPFVVQASDTEVQAMGTAFNVRLRSEAIEVTVTEGRVRLKSIDALQARSSGGTVHRPDDSRRGGSETPGARRGEVMLSAGSAAVAAAGVIEPVQLAEEVARRRIAWRDGVVELQGETLAQAVDEFNRYRKAEIVIVDPAVASLRVGGRFGTDEADKFVDALVAQFSIRTIEGDAGRIYLLGAEPSR